MKYRTLFIFTLVISLVFLAGCRQNNDEIPPLQFKLEIMTQPMKKAESYQLAATDKLPTEMDGYKLVSQSIDKDKFIALANKFSFSPTQQELNGGADGIWSCTTEGRKLIVAKDGRLTYVDNQTSQTTNAGNLLSDEENIKRARDFLSSKGILPSTFSYSSISNGDIGTNSDGTKVVRTKGVFFNQIIGGVRVYGDAKILVVLKEDGQVQEVRCVYYDTAFYKKIKLKSVQEAFADLQGAKGYETSELWIDEPGQIILNKVELVYFQQRSMDESPYLYPVYLFTGVAKDKNGKDAKYYGYVEAITR